MAGLALSMTEVAALCNTYADFKDADFVNYMAFCDVIDEVFTIKGLEQNPDKVVTLALADEIGESPMGLACPTLTETEKTELSDIYSVLQPRVRNEGIQLKIFFQDFDGNNDGCITEQQFIRTLNRVLQTSDYETNLIAKAYACRMGSNYRRFVADVDMDDMANKPESDEYLSSPSSPPPMMTYQDANRDTWGRMEQHLSYLVGKRRLRVRDFFLSDDKLRTGVVPRLSFYRSLTRGFGIPLNEAQLQAIADRFAVPSQMDRIDYMAFARAVTKTRMNRVYETTTEDEPALKEMLTDMRGFIQRERMVLKPVFKDFDKRGEDHVTREQFARALSMFNMLPPTPALREMLFNKYASVDPLRSADRFVNYQRFLCDVVEGAAPAPSTGGSGYAESTLGNAGSNAMQRGVGELSRSMRFGRPDRSVDAILAGIRQEVYVKRMRLDEFFRDMDKLRHCTISRMKFFRGLSSAGFILNENEMHALADAFPADSFDEFGRPLVLYMDFVKAVDQVFTLKGLEQDPNVDVEATVSGFRTLDKRLLEGDRSDLFNGRADGFSEEESERLYAVLRQMALKAARLRLEMGPAFSDFDRKKGGYVPSTVFERVLSMTDLYPESTRDLELMMRKFREPSCDSGIDVNYKAFSKALQVAAEGAPASEILDAVQYREKMRGRGDYPGFAQGAPAGGASQPAAAAPSVPVEDIFASMFKIVARRRVRLSDFLSDGDRLKSGRISFAKFRNGLARAGIDLGEGELQSLEGAFRSTAADDMVDWRNFMYTFNEYMKSQS
mmetsp:Transcript_24738/g.77567  ORF Transcript_24738/g.77567 Transcript_24738/m.77567 type:complete len:782 (-) Transcript_24738:234-2579(-)|eukprot:CAMPEP_0118863256 /NCGR_PEP_ID=MMETSP1163-20130328/8197_1 /TAXON_ID=124430 /ORGANISM="Phaeomonas parva, Strain CCMP2877" /LENGTH=781 /DNA_ID=CAMNT_0006797241 /DNA_START=396 /DNA_END=2741 /DNA_ORIENTATION=+